MAILKKENRVELIFYILLIILVSICITMATLKEIGYIKTAEDECKLLCEGTDTISKYINEKCECCTHKEVVNKMETIIEDRCYQPLILNTNETKT